MSVARRRFRFIKEIAEGGFGKVYLAEQLSSDGFSRIVAVKLLHAKWSSHDEVVMRTRDEARLLGLIRHQHIVKVEDLTSIDGKCAIVMEYLEGVDLKGMTVHLTDRGIPFPRGALFEIMLSVASALDAAYNGKPLQGNEPLRVLHRDIKPSNIFTTVAGQVKLLDFGTARANFAQREAKTQALAFGSQGYMAPERMLGEEDTPAADVFSLGVTLYEMLALDSFGRIPPRPNKFVAKVEERVSGLALGGDSGWNDDAREVLRLMLSYEPSDRPSAAQLVDIFDNLSSDSADMPLRRFCRTLVAEARASEEELDTGDPLIGELIDEDESSVFGVGAGGVPQVATVPAPEGLPSQLESEFGGPPPPPPSGLGTAPPPEPSSDRGKAATPAPAPVVTSGPTALVEDHQEEGGGGALKLVLIGAAVLALLVAVVVVIAVAVGGAALVLGGGSPGEAVVVEEPVQPEEEGYSGSEILEADSRTDVKKSATVLTTSDGGAIDKVTITGLGFGYKAEWDGEGELQLGEVGEGTFRTIVAPKSGSKARGKFEVVGGKTCAFDFDLSAGEWQGACE